MTNNIYLIEVNIINKKINQPFTYMVDFPLYKELKYGDIVLVEFGDKFESAIVKNKFIEDEDLSSISKSNQNQQFDLGIEFNEEDLNIKQKYKKIIKVLDNQFLSKQSEKLIDYLTNKLYANYEDIYKLVISKNKISDFTLEISIANLQQLENEISNGMIVLDNEEMYLINKLFKNEIDQIKYNYSDFTKEERLIINRLIINKIIDINLKAPKISLTNVYKLKDFDSLDLSKINNAKDDISNYPKENSTLDYYINKKELIKYYGLSEYKFKKLKDNNLFEIKEILRSEEENYNVKKEEQKIELSNEQKDALKAIEKSNKISLLHGVTGSGKTAIYIKIIEKIINDNKQALLLVPEVLLTQQMVIKMQQYFPGKVGYFHNALTKTEHQSLINRVKNEEIKVVIGTRSTAFLEIPKLNYVIVDEEHDASYKQNSYPFYNINDLYDFWIGNSIKVLLATATPNILTYTKAIKGLYNLVELNNRHNNATLPKINLIPNLDNNILTDLTKKKINEKLNNNENVLILFNVKGYSRNIQCQNCGHVPMCPNCDLTLKYFKNGQTLQCSFCDYKERYNGSCPVCKSHKVEFIGMGIEKVEEYLKGEFTTNIYRIDAQIAKTKTKMNNIIEEFNSQTGNILLGTQIISKGLNFPNLDYVVVLNTDNMLFFTDFVSNEQTYQLLEQVSGRSGRFSQNGVVDILTQHPDHFVYKAVSEHNYLKFYNEEMQNRHLQKTTPYYYIAMVEIRLENEDLLMKIMERLQEELVKSNLLITAINEPYISQINGQNRRKIYIKYKNENIKEIIRSILNNDEFKNIKVLVDLQITTYGY